MAFNDFSEYVFKYSELDKKMPDMTSQKRYHDRWMGKYAQKYKKSEENEVGIEWDLRCKKSLREIFSSATFFIEAQKNLEMKCFSSYYFCLYYSLFHAIYACNFLDTESTIDKLKDITHSNIINVFVSAFANTKNDILSREVSTIFNELRYKREYYSYVTPFNNIFSYENDLVKLKQCLLECYQLANFHSMLVQKSFSKKIDKRTVIDDGNKSYFLMLFKSLFGKEDLNGKVILDDSCKNMMEELLSYGCKSENIALDLEHQFDEFHTYDNYYRGNCTEYELSIQDIWSFIYMGLI